MEWVFLAWSLILIGPQKPLVFSLLNFNQATHFSRPVVFLNMMRVLSLVSWLQLHQVAVRVLH